LYFFNVEGDMVHEIFLDKRISNLATECIDGGDHPELLVSTTTRKGKSLIAYELKEKNLASIDVKWEIDIPGVVNSIAVGDINNDGQEEVI